MQFGSLKNDLNMAVGGEEEEDWRRGYKRGKKKDEEKREGEKRVEG